MAGGSTNDARNHQQEPEPNPALKKLGKLIGTWEAYDPSGAGAISGQSTFKWMEGGNFLIQHVNFDGARGIEIIGYDERSNSLKSHYFDSSGSILEYIYEVDGDTITISIDMPHAKGRFVEDGNSYTGRWE